MVGFACLLCGAMRAESRNKGLKGGWIGRAVVALPLSALSVCRDDGISHMLNRTVGRLCD